MQRVSVPLRGRRLFSTCQRAALQASVSGTLLSLPHSAQVYDQLSAGTARLDSASPLPVLQSTLGLRPLNHTGLCFRRTT
jgi:hypothetical protein